VLTLLLLPAICPAEKTTRISYDYLEAINADRFTVEYRRRAPNDTEQRRLRTLQWITGSRRQLHLPELVVNGTAYYVDARSVTVAVDSTADASSAPNLAARVLMPYSDLAGSEAEYLGHYRRSRFVRAIGPGGVAELNSLGVSGGLGLPELGAPRYQYGYVAGAVLSLGSTYTGLAGVVVCYANPGRGGRMVAASSVGWLIGNLLMEHAQRHTETAYKRIATALAKRLPPR
jgi:hypothetical protein